MKYIKLAILFFCCWCLLDSHTLIAQKSRKPAMGGAFGTSQWYVGVQTGVNYTSPQVTQGYQEFYRPDNELASKAYYNKFNNPGQQIGLITAFSPTRLINVSLSVLHVNYQFGYQQEFTWENPEEASQSIAINYEHILHLSYLTAPLTFRFKILSSGKIQPYILGGGYYGILLQANKKMTESGIDRSTGNNIAFNSPTISVLAKNLFIQSHIGYLYGGGFAYQPGTITLTLEVSNQQSLNNITNVKNRYVNSREMSGFGNVQDDLMLGNLQISTSLLFPLKFLTKTFRPVIL